MKLYVELCREGDSMNVYDRTVELISNGVPFKINLKERCLKVGNEELISNGCVNGELKLEAWSVDRLKELYEIYRVSRPSERSEKKRNNYFKALSVNELTDEELIFGTNRELARFELEYYLLSNLLNGLKWWNGNHWFYRNGDLVVLKEWING